MKNITRYLLFVLFISCIFISKVNAECSYQERKDLLNAAKGVDIGYEIKTDVVEEEGEDPDTGELKKYKNEYYSFQFYVNNLSDNIFIKYYNGFDDENSGFINKENLKDGIFYFDDYNTTNIYKYYFEVYSSNNNCPGELMYTHKITKPRYNYFSTFDVCGYEGMEDYKNCEKFITNEINKNESEFAYEAMNYYNTKHFKDEKVNKDNKYINFFKKYWYCFVIIFIIIVIGILYIIKIIKKRGELK